MSLRDHAEHIAADLVELRHSLHREPELGLHLPRTQQRILDALAGLPLQITPGDQLSSITAVLRGARPGPAVLLRVDMDALPLDEALDLPFRSTTPGVMHACGHDLHTSMLLGAAHLLANRRQDLSGDVVFMFQPGEEGHDGAGHMINEGVLAAAGQLPIAAYAIHVFSGRWPHGVVATRPGPIMAASDIFSATVHGKGGHGAAPHNAQDPIPAVCEISLALHTFLTRTISAFDPAVITVGQVHAGNLHNIIPESAYLEATVRTFSPEVQERIAAGLIRLSKGIAAAHDLRVDTTYTRQYPNDENEAAFAGRIATELFGARRVTEMTTPITVAEDFSRILERFAGEFGAFCCPAPGSCSPRWRSTSASASAAPPR